MLQRLERVVLRCAGLVEAGRVRQCGVAICEVDEPAFLATLRNENLDLAPGACGQPALERLALIRLRRHMHLGRRDAHFVELLDSGREHLRFRIPHTEFRIRSVLGVQFHAFDDAA